VENSKGKKVPVLSISLLCKCKGKEKRQVMRVAGAGLKTDIRAHRNKQKAIISFSLDLLTSLWC